MQFSHVGMVGMLIYQSNLNIRVILEGLAQLTGGRDTGITGTDNDDFFHAQHSSLYFLILYIIRLKAYFLNDYRPFAKYFPLLSLKIVLQLFQFFLLKWPIGTRG